MNEHTLVYTLVSGWTPVGLLPPGPVVVLAPWAWVERTFVSSRELAPAWYSNGTSASFPLKRRTGFKPWDPRNECDRKLGCLHRLGKLSPIKGRWLLPTQELVEIAVRLATDCGIPVYCKSRFGFEAELLPRFKRPDNVTYDFDVGASLLKFGDLRPEVIPGPDAVRYSADGPVLTRHRFLVGAQ